MKSSYVYFILLCLSSSAMCDSLFLNFGKQGDSGEVNVYARVLPISGFGLALSFDANIQGDAIFLNFGEVKPYCPAVQSPSITCEQFSEFAQYTTPVALNVHGAFSSGAHIRAYRSEADTFNAVDGIVIEDENLRIEPLAVATSRHIVNAAAMDGKTRVIKVIGIRIHKHDEGGEKKATIRLILESL